MVRFDPLVSPDSDEILEGKQEMLEGLGSGPSPKDDVLTQC